MYQFVLKDQDNDFLKLLMKKEVELNEVDNKFFSMQMIILVSNCPRNILGKKKNRHCSSDKHSVTILHKPINEGA